MLVEYHDKKKQIPHVKNMGGRLGLALSKTAPIPIQNNSHVIFLISGNKYEKTFNVCLFWGYFAYGGAIRL